MRLNLDKGVCAHVARNQKSITVANVHEFPGHVACDSRSNSEIVVPLFDQVGRLRAVLDVDSETLADFDEIDQTGLEQVARLLVPIWESNFTAKPLSIEK
jgi:GAF domain-containing protein